MLQKLSCGQESYFVIDVDVVVVVVVVVFVVIFFAVVLGL